MYYKTKEILQNKGYERYEISNYSLKRMEIFFLLLCNAPFNGDVEMTTGGVSSYIPPSGLPMLAHAATSSERSVHRARYPFFMSIVRLMLCLIVHLKQLVDVLTAIAESGHFVLSA